MAKVLVLGGTRFVGRHIVCALVAQRHAVLALHRGQTKCELPDGVLETFGDRSEPLPPEAVAQRWDAVVDVSGQRPEQLWRSTELDTGWYLFISTLNVYADLSRPGVDEASPTILEFDSNDEAMAYGGNKASCERLVQARFGDRATILRPGIIAGPWDYTGRFSYWPRRALRGGPFLVPAPASRVLQFIDARDLAAFAVRVITDCVPGAYNMAGPAARFSIGELADACVAAGVERGIRSNAVYVDGNELIGSGVEPWTDVPMWLEEPSFAGMFEVDNRKAIAAGLELRPPEATVHSLMDWLAQPDSVAAATPGLSFERETEIIKNL
jgi:2'-hydroxyisoflavone reductase